MNSKKTISSISEEINKLDFNQTVSFKINVHDSTVTKIEKPPKPINDEIHKEKTVKNV
jgi:hypothetical protein